MNKQTSLSKSNNEYLAMLNKTDLSLIKVIYITGSPRSGSTILSKVLGQIPGFFQAGELRFLWDKNFLDEFPCGCGEEFVDCEIWTRIFQKAYGGFDLIDAKMMLEYRERYTRTKHIPYMVTQSGRNFLRKNLDTYLSNLDKLYVSIQNTTGCEVIIDSSKFSSYGFVLSMVPSIEVYYLHLIRDSRAVAYSRMKKKKWDETGIYMARYSPLRSSIQWDVLNATSEMLLAKPSRYMRVRYEDFIRLPVLTIEKVANFVGAVEVDTSFIDNNSVSIKQTHSNWGNPIRTTIGKLNLRVDDEWKLKLNPASNVLVSLLTSPLLNRYGYL